MKKSRVSILILFVFVSFGVMAAEENNTDNYIQLAVANSPYKMTFEELLKVKITTASKVPEEQTKSTSNVQVITAADLKQLGARSYEDALQMVPSYSQRRGRTGTRKPTLRGGDATKILTLIDGHVLNEPETGSAMDTFVAEIPVESIERIEFIKGPGSSLYGANAFLGVINIITKKADDVGGLAFSIDTEFESGNFIGNKYNVQLGHRFNDDAALMMNVNWLDHQGPELKAAADAFGRSGEAYTGREKLDFLAKLEVGEFQLRGRYFQRKGEGFFGVLDVLAEGSELKTFGGHLEGAWNYDVSEKLNLKALAYVDHVDLDNYFVGFTAGSAPDHPTFSLWNSTGFIGNPKLKKTSRGAEFQSTYRGWSQHTLVAGMAARHERQYDAQMFSNSNPAPLPTVQDVSAEYNWMDNASRNIVSAYLQDIIDIQENLHLNAGIRIDKFSSFGTSWNPRVGLAWEVSEQFNIKATYGTAFRAPTFGAQFIKNNPAFVGNPDLDSENIETFEASVSYRYQDRFLGSVAYIRNQVEDLIQPVKGGVAQNVGEVDVDAVEVEGRYFIEHGGYLRAYYSLSDSERRSEGSSSSDLSNYSAGWELNLPLGDNLNWNVHSYWRSKVERGPEDTRGALPDYVVVNSTLVLHNYIKDVELAISIFNLFDEDYAFVSNMNAYKDDYTAPGRSFVVRAEWMF